MSGPVSTQAASTRSLERVATVVLGTAVVCGCLRQGGFFPDGVALLVALVVVAAAARCGSGAPRASGPVAVAIAAVLTLAGWTVVAAALHGDVGDAVAPAALTAAVAGAVWVGSGVSETSWTVLRAVLLSCGAVVALTGWAGTALHVEPLALVSSGLWRASSTITYANASAAFLVITLLLVVATHAPDRVFPDRCAAAVMVLGLVATMSRAGLVAAAVGLAICASAPHLRVRLLALWPAVPAGVVAAAGLLPALPEGAPAQPLPAVAGVVAGAAVLVARGRLVPVLVGGAIAAGAVLAPAGAALHGIADTRLTSRSAERDDLRAVTLEQFASAPVAGVGPGRLDLVYADHSGTVVRAEYTHDEYLQTAAETGAVGLALVLAAFGALGVAAARRWSTPGGPGALAIVAAFGVHSAFDFLWHIPVLPLLAAAAAVPLLTIRTPTPMGTT